jgi:Domain of unknown function (DUF4868)
MTNQADGVLKKTQKVDFKAWQAKLWLVKRRLSGKEALYSVLRVETDDKLNGRLKKAVTDKIDSKNLVLEEYTFLSADQDDRVLTLDSADTDFVKIEKEINKGVGNPKAGKYEELLDSWALVIELRHHDQIVFGVRKVNALTQAKKVLTRTSLFFQNSLLIDVTDKRVFTLDLNLDFIVIGGFAFIINKQEFESALNFRKGMEDSRDTVLDELVKLGVVSDVVPLREHIGINLNHLRKISTIRKSAYYQDPTFIQSLIRVLKEQNWGVAISDGKITVTTDNAETVLTLLSNSRLISLINQEVFDAAVKKRVT